MRVKSFIKGLRYHPPENRQGIKPEVMISMIFTESKPQTSDFRQTAESSGQRQRDRGENCTEHFYTFCIFFIKDQRIKISSDVFEDCVGMFKWVGSK